MAKKRTRRRRKKQSVKFVTWFKSLDVKSKIFFFTGATVTVLLLALIIFIASKFSKIQKDDIKEDEIHINELAEDVGVGYTNIALFGVDARNGINEKGVRTDTIIIASLNNETREVKLVSVYRDTLLDLTNGKIKKCNSAYSSGGAQQAISMLNMNLDLNITDYVTVDWSAVVDTIDLMGGIEVDVQQNEIKGINEHMISTAEATGKPMKKITKAGLQTLNGVQATTYCRIRSTPGSDYARTERQRKVIQIMMEKAMKSDLKTINSIIDKIFPKIKTSLTMTEILSYAKSFTKYKIGETAGFPFKKGSGTIPGKGSSVYPITLKTNVQELHKFLYGTEDYEPSSKVVEISGEIAYIVASSKNQNNNSNNNNSNNNNNNNNNNTVTPNENTGGGEQPGEDEPGTGGEDEPGTEGEGGTGTGGEGGTGTEGEGGTGTGGEGGTGTGGEGGTGTEGEGGTGTGGEGGTETGGEGGTSTS